MYTKKIEPEKFANFHPHTMPITEFTEKNFMSFYCDCVV